LTVGHGAELGETEHIVRINNLEMGEMMRNVVGGQTLKGIEGVANGSAPQGMEVTLKTQSIELAHDFIEV
jgi:hypothetical protein